MTQGQDTVIRAEGLGKRYRLGSIGTGTLAHDLHGWWCRLTGRPDPNATVDAPGGPGGAGGGRDHIWAVRGLDLSVEHGEILGVIGRNGAGKSTLLKVLTRITRPTEGTVRMRGRVASLLEVGTGFHPELSGRENIFLNGAILGMTRAEIREQFEAIVNFAGVERFIDTPVKRYSSGMYVRLAFAVAAHLRPEIMLIDEVLAVGDAAFQRKCLGKMGDVAREGRTILFVSHNMAAVRDLCTRAILLEQGRVAFEGPTDEAVARYLRQGPSDQAVLGPGALDAGVEEHNPGRTPWLRCDELALTGEDGLPRTVFASNAPVYVRVRYACLREVPRANIIVTLTDDDGRALLRSEQLDAGGDGLLRPGEYEAVCVLPAGLLGGRRFLVNVNLQYHGVQHLAYKGLLAFEVEFTGHAHRAENAHSATGAFFRPLLDWRGGPRAHDTIQQRSLQ